MWSLVLALTGIAPLEGALDVRSPPSALRAAECGACHTTQYADWSTSRHRAAHTNALYQEGLRAEPALVCSFCHAPLREQVAEVRVNLAAYRALGPYGDGAASGMRPEPLAAEGVNCAVCHLRAGTVLTPDATSAIHPTEASAALRSGEVCRDCHEFAILEEREGRVHRSPALMQSTWSEWVAWGGSETCVGCHMPDGRHLFRGAHDTDWLRASVRVTRTGESLRVETVGVGHHLPTGDLFRHLTLEAADGDTWRTVATFGRRFALEPAGDTVHKVLAEDTSLRPGEPVDVALPGRWRLRYHYGSTKDEARARLPAELLTLTLLEGP